jgi:hypothetical protein
VAPALLPLEHASPHTVGNMHLDRRESRAMARWHDPARPVGRCEDGGEGNLSGSPRGHVAAPRHSAAAINITLNSIRLRLADRVVPRDRATCSFAAIVI